MNHYSSRRLRALKCFLILFASGLYATTSLRLVKTCVPAHARAQTSPAQRAGDANENAGFDELVRADFFAGMMGNEARLTRGMKFCEEILAQNPKHAEALVWHGGGLLTRAAQAYAKGEQALGDKLWQRGLAEMNRAVEFEPQNMGVKIGRSATLIGLAQAGWDSSDEQARASACCLAFPCGSFVPAGIIATVGLPVRQRNSLILCPCQMTLRWHRLCRRAWCVGDRAGGREAPLLAAGACVLPAQQSSFINSGGNTMPRRLGKGEPDREKDHQLGSGARVRA